MYIFSEQSEKRFLKLMTMFPDKRSVILPALYLLQKDRGFVDTEGMEYIAKRIGDPIAVSHVYGVATFYTMYNKKPVGKHHVQICANISCYIMGSDAITKKFCDNIGIEKGKTSADNIR
jgi:NADH-quinone oxidoreductase subunit E